MPINQLPTLEIASHPLPLIPILVKAQLFLLLFSPSTWLQLLKYSKKE